MDRFLKATSSIIKGKIEPNLYIDAYDTLKAEEKRQNAYLYDNYTEEGIELVGLDKEKLSDNTE